jgi:N6-L-threonylcarbamoyladenine synthase
VLVLGIETSCDETAVGIVEDRLTACVPTSSPPRSRCMPASAGSSRRSRRERTSRRCSRPSERALAEAGARLTDLDAIAVTRGPGLAGALLVGVAAAKGLALAHDLPLIGVNHLRAHIEVAQLEHGALEGPLVALVVSGGHTSILAREDDGTLRELGATRRRRGGGGVRQDRPLPRARLPRWSGDRSRIAQDGRRDAHAFPRPMLDVAGYDLSLSGLKSAVVRELDRLDAAGTPVHLPDVAASFQEAIVDVQVAKTMRAAERPRRADGAAGRWGRGQLAAARTLRRGLSGGGCATDRALATPLHRQRCDGRSVGFEPSGARAGRRPRARGRAGPRARRSPGRTVIPLGRRRWRRPGEDELVRLVELLAGWPSPSRPWGAAHVRARRDGDRRCRCGAGHRATSTTWMRTDGPPVR